MVYIALEGYTLSNMSGHSYAHILNSMYVGLVAICYKINRVVVYSELEHFTCPTNLTNGF